MLMEVTKHKPKWQKKIFFFFFCNFNKNGQKEGKIQLKNKEKKIFQNN